MFPFSPMLARSGPLPELGNWAFEVKWDGFRALVSTAEGLGIRSRRGRDLTEIVRELDELPRGLVLDGELVAFDDEGLPSFAWACDRLVHGDPSVPLTFVVFDLLQEDGEIPPAPALPGAPREGRGTRAPRVVLAHVRAVRGRRGALYNRLRARSGGSRRQARRQLVPPGLPRLAHGRESPSTGALRLSSSRRSARKPLRVAGTSPTVGDRARSPLESRSARRP